MTAGHVELEYRCDECERTVTSPWDHGEDCVVGGAERERKRYERMHSALKGIYAVAEHGIYGNMIPVRDAAFALVESHVVGREGSWEAALAERVEAAGNWALVGYDELEALRKALEAE